MALKQITAQDFKEAVDSLNNGYTCWRKILGRTDEGTELCFVVGWSDAGYDEDDAKKNGYADGSYTICSKIACQSRYNGSQTDYDGDFEMPYDKETGDVWDTDTMVSNNESDWVADADTYNKDAQDIWDTYGVPNEDGFTALDAMYESKKKPESKKSERWVPGTAFDYDEYNYFVRLFSGFLSKKGIANTITGGLKRKISVPSLTINGKTFDNVQFILNLAPNYALPFGFVMVADGLAYDFGDVMDPGKDPMGRDTLKGVNEYVFDSLLNGDYPLSCLGDAKKLKVVKESADKKSKGCSMKRKIESLTTAKLSEAAKKYYATEEWWKRLEDDYNEMYDGLGFEFKFNGPAKLVDIYSNGTKWGSITWRSMFRLLDEDGQWLYKSPAPEIRDFLYHLAEYHGENLNDHYNGTIAKRSWSA